MTPPKNPRTNKRWLSKRALSQGYKEQAAWINKGVTHTVTLEASTASGVTDYIVKHLREAGATAHNIGVASIELESFSQLDEARAFFAEEAKR